MSPISKTALSSLAGETPRSRGVADHREVLLATDGSAAAFAATRFACTLAAQWETTPHVLTVLPPSPLAFDPVGISVAVQPNLDEYLRSEVQRQLDALAGATWSREVTVGSPAAEIVHVAERRNSDLIVVGLRPHAFLDRVFRDETALSVMRHATVPVLAVTPLLARPPRHIAVAIDFSRASIAAARAALTLLEAGGQLELVYVEPPGEPHSEETEGYGTIYAQGVAAAFSRLRLELAGRAGVTVDTVVLHGNVAAELLSFAERAEVDVLALGSQRHSTARRSFVGSVTTALTRAATRSLLVLPPGRRG